MPDSQDSETATSTVSLLPVELTIHHYHGRETRIVLHKLPAIMGRDERADVPLFDPWISHRHCEIDQIGDALVVRDLDSKNGFSIHGHQVRESQVLSGERLTVGRTEIIVRYGGNAHVAIEADEASEPQKPSPNRARDTAEILY